MEEALIAAWHKLKVAMRHIEKALGFIPEEANGTAHTDSGGGGGDQPPKKPGGQ